MELKQDIYTWVLNLLPKKFHASWAVYSGSLSLPKTTQQAIYIEYVTNASKKRRFLGKNKTKHKTQNPQNTLENTSF